MKGTAIRQSQMFAQVSAFGERHAEWLAATSAGRAALVSLRDAMGALRDHARTQGAGRPSERARAKRAARDQLRMSLRILNRTMRAMAIDVPADTQRFLPKSNGDAALLTAARTLLVDARRLEPAFAAYGLPPTVVDDLQASIDAFDRASEEAQAIGQAGMAATRAIDAVLAQARRAVRQLDAIVSNLHGNDAVMMAAWRSARRVGRMRRAKRSVPASALVPVRSIGAAADRQLRSADANALLYLRVVRVIFEMVHATAPGGSICP